MDWLLAMYDRLFGKTAGESMAIRMFTWFDKVILKMERTIAALDSDVQAKEAEIKESVDHVNSMVALQQRMENTHAGLKKFTGKA